MNDQVQFHFGFDVGGTKIEIAIFDTQLQLLGSWRKPTPKENYLELVDTIVEMVQQADTANATQGSVGLGIPGIQNEDGTFRSANIPALMGHRLQQDLESALTRPISIDNDVKTFALSELHGGSLQGDGSSLGLIIGTGLAGCQAIDGNLFRGAQGVAGEYGHMSLPLSMQQKYQFPVLPCGCGGKGCAEQYLSGTGFGWMCKHLDSSFSDIPHLMQAYRDQNPMAIRIFDTYIDCLAAYLSDLMLALDPVRIVIGGGVSNIPELFEKLSERMPKYMISGLKIPQIMAPTFGDSSGVRGAAIIGRDTV